MLQKEKCKFCGHEWVARVMRPVSCPKCQRRNYRDK